MSEKTPLTSPEPTEPPPTYESAAAQHGALPLRSVSQSGKKPLPRGPFPLDIPIIQQLRGKRVILASASPRRKQLLAQVGLTNIEIIPSTKPEDLSKELLGPWEYVRQTATRKGLEVYETVMLNSLISIPDPAVVIAADTVIVTTSGAILEKPRSEADHLRMLKMLRGQGHHKVYTAVCAIAPREDARAPGYNMLTTVEETKVVFAKDLGDEMIEAYVKTREGVDKAGGYAIQGMGPLLIEKIEGPYDNVVGLPLRKTLAIVEKAVLNQDEGAEEEGEDSDEE